MFTLRIFIADNHDVLRRGLKSLFSAHSWSVCGEARNGLDAVRMAVLLKPDIVTLGLELPGLSGTEAARQIRARLPGTEILIYTVHDEEFLITEALRAGARAHVLKSDKEETLVEAVASLARHQPYFSTKAAETLQKHLLKSGTKSTAVAVLTYREREIVQLIADAKSNKQIASHFKISIKTVETHRSAIMRKLDVKSIAELVRYAIRNRFIEL